MSEGASGEVRRLYLVDGHAQFFRAYHAVRSRMTSPVTKEPTNATFGFVGMLLKMLREERPEYVGVAVDVSGDRGTFRSEIYPAYKATRDAPPEDLGPQIERCVSLLEAIGMPVLGAEGFEADDVLATVVEKLRGEAGLVTRLVSKDKDLQQLLEAGRVEMYDVHTGEMLDAARLLEEKGVEPGSVVEMLALMGDTVDNVPGVAGIGPKTAAQLIAEHGSIAGVVAAAEAGTIKGKRRERILEAVEMLPTSRELVTLRRDAPVSFGLESARVESLDLASLDPILAELGFNRHREELRELLSGGAGGAGGAGVGSRGSGASAGAGGAGGGLFESVEAERLREVGSACGYRIVRTAKQLDEMLASLDAAWEKGGCVAVDTETTALRPMKAELAGLSCSAEPGGGWYVPVRSPDASEHLDESALIEAVRTRLEDPTLPKCGHNLKYDLLVLRRCGVELRGIAFDSMIASYLIDASRSSHSLDALALASLGHRCTPISELIGTGKKQKRFDEVELGVAGPYAAEDADVSLRLMRVMEPELERMGLTELFRGVEMPLLSVLAELEWNGVRVDPAELERQRERLAGRIEELKGELAAAAPRPFNPDSPKQLAAVLFNKPDAEEPGLGIKPIKRTKTGYSTDAEVLEKLAADPEVGSEVPGLIVEHRRLSKLVGTYLEALKEEINDRTGRVHASFNQTVAATGRLSSSDPNLQNIPIRTEMGREIRRAFVADEGCVLIGADYSQIELRVLAHLSGDAGLREAFSRGEDIHRAVAAEIHGVEPGEVTKTQREGAKMVNFGIVYGITPFGLARRLGVSTTEATRIIDGYRERFPGIATFLAECVAQAERDGYVETILKRRRPIVDIDSRQPNRRALAERMAINSVVQGSAADLIKVAMIDLHARLSANAERDGGARPEVRGVRMLVQIHDELLFEVEEGSAGAAEKVIAERMESAMELSVPLVVETFSGVSWFEGK